MAASWANQSKQGSTASRAPPLARRQAGGAIAIDAEAPR
jgi:hypothetical protein